MTINRPRPIRRHAGGKTSTAKVWSDRQGFAIPTKLRTELLETLRRACVWASTNQIRHTNPDWDANHGRLPCMQNTRTGKSMRSIVWNVARMSQGLLSAARVLEAAGARRDFIREVDNTAELGLYQDTRAQIYDPEFPALRGAIREETPICFQINPRDGIECSQGFLTKIWREGKAADPLWLNRTRDQLSWTVHWLLKRPEWPLEYVFFGWDWIGKPDQFPRPYADSHLRIRKPNSPVSFYNMAMLIPICQYVALTGDRKMLTRAVVAQGDWLLEVMLDPETGALRTPGAGLGHHTETLGGQAGALSNDDGVIIGLLCLDRFKPGRGYREAALRNAGWWLRLQETPRLRAAIPATMLLMLELARLTGQPEYLDWVLTRLESLLARQNRSGDARFDGAFVGEDGHGDRPYVGSSADETTSLRMTSYSTIALSKLVANARTWSPSYSRFGW